MHRCTQIQQIPLGYYKQLSNSTVDGSAIYVCAPRQYEYRQVKYIVAIRTTSST